MKQTRNPPERKIKTAAPAGLVAQGFRFEQCKTIGEALRLVQERARERTRGKLPEHVHDEIWRHLLRYSEPWPDWVLRIAAEVYHVSLPTIPKETIEDALRVVHFYVFEARIDGSNKAVMPKAPNLSPEIMGALVGHVLAMVTDGRGKLEAARGKIPAAELEELSGELSEEAFQREIAPVIAEYFKAKPLAFIGFGESLINARHNTFDKCGSRKETPLTKIYEKILSDWPEIERLSGPKALCEHLSAFLSNDHFDDKYERVKKICQRMRITF